jgi:hypothetical protein
MWRKAVLVGIAISLVAAAAAAADPLDPKTHIVSADQSAAVAALLTRADLGSAWSGGEITPSSFKAPRCPSLEPSFHKLTMTAHAEASFNLGSTGWQIDSDVTMLKTKQQVATQYKLLFTPALPGCIRYDLLKTTGASTNTSLGPSEKVKTFPKLATVSVLYRVPIYFKSGKQTLTFDDDTLFLSKDRTQFWVNFLAPGADVAILDVREKEIAKTLLNRVRA